MTGWDSTRATPGRRAECAETRWLASLLGNEEGGRTPEPRRCGAGGLRWCRGVKPVMDEWLPCRQPAFTLSGPHLREDIAGRRERQNRSSGPLDGFPSPFLAIDEREDANNGSASRADGFDRLQCRTTGGDHILDHRNAIAGPKGTFDQLPRSMCLRFLPDREGPQRGRASGARVAYCVADRIGAEGEASDGVDYPRGATKLIEGHRPDERESFRTHRRQSRVDV